MNPQRTMPSNRRRAGKPIPPLELVPAGEVDVRLLRALGRGLAASLGVQWRLGEALTLCAEWRDARSGLYRSIHLIHALMDRAEAEGDARPGVWRLAIAEAGLCAQGVGEVFGEAAHAGCCAVVGLVPLRRGSGADADVLGARLLTEAVHEVGHLAGGEHCRRASCVMYPSLNIADTDRKEAAFCPACRRALKLRALQES